MPNLHYTAIIHDDTHAIEFAEHYADEAEAVKRCAQLAKEAQTRGPWKSWQGTEPPEAFVLRQVTVKGEAEDQDAYDARLDALIAKVVTASVLTDPEVDDTEEARPLPPVAVARAELETAEQFLADCREHVAAVERRIDAHLTAGNRQLAESAAGELDAAKSRLYHAEQAHAAAVAKVAEYA